LWIVGEFILLDFGLQIFGFGSAGPRTRCVAAFAFQLLLFWFVARRVRRVGVLPQLQEALVPLLVLPVREDLREGEGEGGGGYKQDWIRVHSWRPLLLCLIISKFLITIYYDDNYSKAFNYSLTLEASCIYSLTHIYIYIYI